MIYCEAEDELAAFAARGNIPFVETQAGNGALAAGVPMNFGSPGATGFDCANDICRDADLVIGVGDRFQDFTTGSGVAVPERGAQAGFKSICILTTRASGLQFRSSPTPASRRKVWFGEVGRVTAPPNEDSNALPTDAQLIGAVQRRAREDTVAMCAAGTTPGA